jgi:3-hydroxymyristoyl/3-hydroxydecanoyl-(acyl carrier protein) dehydratase
MKKYIILSIVLAGLSAVLYYLNKKPSVTSPKVAIERGLSDLKSSGQIEPGQENILKVQLAIADYIAKKL